MWYIMRSKVYKFLTSCTKELPCLILSYKPCLNPSVVQCDFTNIFRTEIYSKYKFLKFSQLVFLICIYSDGQLRFENRCTSFEGLSFFIKSMDLMILRPIIRKIQATKFKRFFNQIFGKLSPSIQDPHENLSSRWSF